MGLGGKVGSGPLGVPELGGLVFGGCAFGGGKASQTADGPLETLIVSRPFVGQSEEKPSFSPSSTALCAVADERHWTPGSGWSTSPSPGQADDSVPSVVAEERYTRTKLFQPPLFTLSRRR